MKLAGDAIIPQPTQSGKKAVARSDREYLLARARQERAMAAETPDEVVSEIHLRLAHEYEVRANVREVQANAANDVTSFTLDDGRSS
jgi:hypothetical protein